MIFLTHKKPAMNCRLFDYLCGHCTKKSEPTSSRTPDFARAACGVALTRKVRPDRVGTPPRAEYRASRPLALPLLSILIFCGGGFEKRNGRQRREAALPFQDSKKRKRAGFKYSNEQTAQIHQISRLHKIRNTSGASPYKIL